MTARIFKPVRSATQSGAAQTKSWKLIFEATDTLQIEPLMGWTSSGDTDRQVKLSFSTKEDAVAYCERNGIAYRVEEPKPVVRKTFTYSDNFKSTRPGPWTH